MIKPLRLFSALACAGAAAFAAPVAAQTTGAERARIMEVIGKFKAGEDIGVEITQRGVRKDDDQKADLELAKARTNECTLGDNAFTPTLTKKPGLREIAVNMDCGEGKLSDRYGMLFAFQNGALESIELRPGGIFFAPPPAPKLVTRRTPPPPPVDHSKPTAAMKGFLDEIKAGDTDAARIRIARVEPLSGNDAYMLDIATDEFIKRLATCELSEYSSKGSHILRVESTVWNCKDGDTLYVDFLGEREADNPYLNIVSIQDAALKAKYEARPPRALAPPALPPRPLRATPLTPEERAQRVQREAELAQKTIATREAFGKAVVLGDMDALKSLVSDRTRVAFQQRDPYFSTDIVADQGRGPEALERIITRAQNELGSARAVNCTKDESRYAPHVCRWTMPRRDRGMFAFLRFSRDELIAATIYYVKREDALKMRERAIKAGKIDG